MLVFAVIAALAAAATPPADPPTNVSAAQVQGDKKGSDDPNKTICKSQPIPGSRMAGRVCATRQEWERNEEASKQIIHDSQAKAGVNETGPPMGMR